MGNLIFYSLVGFFLFFNNFQSNSSFSFSLHLSPPLNSVHPSGYFIVGAILISSFDFNLFGRFLTEQMVATSLKDNYPSVKNFFAINSPGKGNGYIVRYIRCEIFNRSSLPLSPLANFDYYHMFFYPSQLINRKRYLFSNHDSRFSIHSRKQ